MISSVPPLRIGDLTVPSPLALAPMAGAGDAHFRRLLRRLGGLGLASGEFISSEAVARGVRKVLQKLEFREEERPLAIQIYGGDPARMAECAAVVEQLRPDVCDINMGCPANKILKGCAGAALMDDLPRAGRIVEACRRELSVPLTVKLRLGLGRGATPINHVELARLCQDLGVAAVTLHARTAAQQFGGHAAWDEIRRLKDSLAIPVLGNGDVRSPADALAMFRTTGCDGVMIGRAALKDPWIFRRTAAALNGAPTAPPTRAERRDVVLAHVRSLLREEPAPAVALHKLRVFTAWCSHGLPGGRRLRAMIGALRTPELFVEALEQHFACTDNEPEAD